MSRRTVNAILIVHLVVVWSAVVFRIDRFPLTWAPMYSTYKHSERLDRRVEDQAAARKGFLVTHRDRTRSYVGVRELNISKWIMSRLYYQRAFGKGPIKIRQGNMNLGWLNRTVRGLAPDEPRFRVDWTKRLFWTINKTLGYEPDDPRFVVAIRAEQERYEYDPSTLALLNKHTKKKKLRWDDAWRPQWESGDRP